MAGITDQILVFVSKLSNKPQEKNDFKLRQIEIAAPELIQEITGNLVPNQGELAVCLKAHQPCYPLWASDFVDYFYRPGNHNRFTGSASHLEEPVLINGIYIFNVIKYESSDIIMAKEVIDSFKLAELHELGFDSDSQQAVIPQGYELCYYLLILNRGQPSITVASVARPKLPQV